MPLTPGWTLGDPGTAVVVPAVRSRIITCRVVGVPGVIESNTTTLPSSDMRGDVLRMPAGQAGVFAGGIDTTTAGDGTVGWA